MDFMRAATAAVRKAEERVRELIGEATKQGEYSMVATLADLAMRLSLLTPTFETETPPAPAAVRPVNAKASKKAAEYPKFIVDEDRLVKIGWSKKARAEYEHRASRQAAEAVFNLLASMAGQAKFKLENLPPATADDATEVPSYQMYLVLAWLRENGVVRKLDRDTYKWVDRGLRDSFDLLWSKADRR